MGHHVSYARPSSRPTLGFAGRFGGICNHVYGRVLRAGNLAVFVFLGLFLFSCQDISGVDPLHLFYPYFLLPFRILSSLFVQSFGLDPATTIFVYASIPGWILNGVRVCILAYFLWALRGTYHDDPDRSKKVFYLVFGVMFALWFVSLPILTMGSMLMGVWYRLKLVESISLCVEFIAYLLMVSLLWPTRVAKYFQVAVPDLLSGGPGAGYDRL